MKKVARLRVTQDDQFVPPGVKISPNPEQSIIRTTGRIKKPKAVFDPSDNYIPRSHRLSLQPTSQSNTPPGKLPGSAPISPSTPGIRRERSLSAGSNTSNSSINLNNDICIVCSKREPRRGGNYKNKLVSCIDCNKRVHKMCMSVDFYESAPVRSEYKCDNCRTCEICFGSANIGAVTCAKCCKSFHLGCHTPKLSKFCLTERHWKCNKCYPACNDTNSGIKTNNGNDNNAAQMPVKIIRQIIGDNANLNTSVEKIQQSSVNKEQPEQFELIQKLKIQEPLQECTKISEAAVEASTNAAEFSRTETDSLSSSTTDDDSDDEDYKYVDQKKPKIKIENNNNQESITITPILTKKKAADITSQQTTTYLPKREEVKTWTVDQVAEYIAERFPNEAHVFKDQEIDGNALLLLKRSDVVQKLPIKLGPSLRLYHLVLMVQTQTADDPTLGWDCSVDTLLPSED